MSLALTSRVIVFKLHCALASSEELVNSDCWVGRLEFMV
jgi:hypothetical protein